jgi:hypothetical protein
MLKIAVQNNGFTWVFLPNILYAADEKVIFCRFDGFSTEHHGIE